MTEVKAPVRVLQSGKVYRQMFDAEVQLMKSLDASKLRHSHTSVQKVSFPDIQAKAPEQSQSDVTANSQATLPSMLSDRQRTWTEGMPNDSVTENPVLYRQLSTAAAQRLKASAVDKEVQEVHGLPNIVQVQKKGSNTNERISEKRKTRHDKALEDMYNDLCMVSNRTEPRINGIGENLLSQMKENDIIIGCLFNLISLDDELVNFSHERLEQLWKEVESHSSRRREWIRNAHMWFNEIEDERLETITAIFKSYSAKLEKIAFLLSPDIHRLIEKEAMMINQSVLANRRVYAKLQTNLLEEDIEREVKQHRTWLERVKDWKKLNAELAVRQFTEFMNSETICDPPAARQIMEKFLAEQKVLSDKRTNILDQLKELKPPNVSKAIVHKWNSGLGKSYEDLDKLNTAMVKDMHHQYEATCQLCLSEIEKYKQNLVRSLVCDEEDMKRIVNVHFLPLVGSQLKIFETNLEAMDKHLEEVAEKSEKHVKALFKAAQGAAHLWDLHQAGMAKQDRRLQEILEEAREAHDTENQEREMKLDVTLDRLRQESTEEALDVHLEQCMGMLQRIKEGYEEFHTEQLERVAGFPEMIQSELERYEENVCDYFKVKRAKKRVSEDAQQLLNAGSAPAVLHGLVASLTQVEKRSHSLPNASVERTRKRSDRSSKPTTTESDSKTVSSGSVQAIRELFTTDKGTEFFILTSSTDVSGEQEEEEGQNDCATSLPEYVKNINIESAMAKDLRNSIRTNFLNHLDEWKIEMEKLAQDKSKDKVEELASELDLRLHLHEPRSKRIEMDVRNVRAAELVLHKERVNRHCKGIIAALESLKQDFFQMARSHDGEASAFRSIVENAGSNYVAATKTSKLKTINAALHAELTNYVENVKTSLRDFRRTLDITLGKLRESNAQCARSFRLFCEGGNFSPDETIPLRKKLEKVSQRVDNAEGAVMKDLEGMESKRIESATEIVNKVEERYKNHLNDLTFVESMNRWATNAQALIKSEAAFSNGMAAEVGGHLATLRRRVDACEKPNIDKETVSPELLHSYSLEIMESLRKRADYLKCKLTENVVEIPVDSDQELAPEPPKAPEKTPAAMSRKSVTQLASRQSVDTQQGVSQGRGRQPSDDAAIGLIKTILRGPREKSLPDFDEIRSTATGTTRPPPSTANSTSAAASRPKGLQRQNTSSTNPTPEPPNAKRKDINEGVTVVYKRRDTKFEIKYMVFGGKPPEGDDFKMKTKRILYDALDGMLSTAEIYYKQKGIRNPSRPQLIQESFDACAEKVVEKLQKFETQTLEFHNNSLQDYRRLLHNLEYELCDVSRLVFSDLLKKELQNLKDSQLELEKVFKDKEKEWETVKKTNKVDLRPVLGHPDQNEILELLSVKEKNRQATHVEGIEEHARAMKECVGKCASQFAEHLSSVSNKLLTEFDGLITVDDVIVGRVPPHKEPTSVLVRRRQEGYDISEAADPSFGVRPIIERGSKYWPAFDFTKLDLKFDNLSAECTESVGTSHTTLPQAKTTEHRDAVLSKYANAFQTAMQLIEEKKTKRRVGEERWQTNWDESVVHVQNLYKQ